jgi:TonB family protein
VTDDSHRLVVRHVVTLFFVVALFCSGRLVADDETGFELPNLPRSNLPNDQDWYPASARREGLEGRVLVGFDIGSDGRTNKVSVIWSERGDGSVLAANTVRMVGTMRFKVPADWPSTGAWRRWRLGVVYRLHPSGQPLDFAIPVENVVITGSRLPGAPVHSKPDSAESGDAQRR